MKKIIAMMLVILLAGGIAAFAAPKDKVTDNPGWSTPIAPLNPLLNKYATHGHRYDYNDYERNMPWGAGLDVVVYRAEGDIYDLGLDALEVQGRYDFGNNETSVFAVVKIDAWRALFGEKE